MKPQALVSCRAQGHGSTRRESKTRMVFTREVPMCQKPSGQSKSAEKQSGAKQPMLKIVSRSPQRIKVFPGETINNLM